MKGRQSCTSALAPEVFGVKLLHVWRVDTITTITIHSPPTGPSVVKRMFFFSSLMHPASCFACLRFFVACFYASSRAFLFAGCCSECVGRYARAFFAVVVVMLCCNVLLRVPAVNLHHRMLLLLLLLLLLLYRITLSSSLSFTFWLELTRQSALAIVACFDLSTHTKRIQKSSAQRM